MTDEERARDPLAAELRTSCMNSVDLIEYFVDKRGVPLASLLDGLRVDADFLGNTANWIDNYDTYRLYRNCHRSIPGFTHRDWYTVGQATPMTNAPGYFRIILKLLSTDVTYQRLPMMIPRTSKVSEYAVIESRPGRILLRYRIPDRRVRTGYTIGSECWYHLGILSALPKLQDETSPFATTGHSTCCMPIGHILEDCYDLPPSDYAYDDEGLLVTGARVGRWVRLAEAGTAPDTFTSAYDLATREQANAMLVVRELDIGGRRAFRPGEVYDAPHCLFDITYTNRSLYRRIASLLRLGGRRYYEAQLRKTEELYFDLHRVRSEGKRLEHTIRTLQGEPVALSEHGPSAPPDQRDGLTRREREVARLVSLGMRNSDIARDLFISQETVKRHLSNIYAKLNVKNRVQLARKLSKAEPASP